MATDKLTGMSGYGPLPMLIAVGIATCAAAFYLIWRRRLPAVRFILATTAHLLFRMRIVGKENIPARGGALIVSNHVSFADAVLIGCATPRSIRYLMWQPYFDFKPLQPFFRLVGALRMPTNAPKESIRALRNARAELLKGQLIGIFAEGSLTRSGHVMPFERGVERVLEDTNAPVIPVYLDGLWGSPLSMKGGKVLSWWTRPWRRNITVHIGQPIRGAMTAETLRQHVMELGTVAVSGRKTKTATLSYRFVESAKRNWSRLALADSAGKSLTFGRALTAALLLKNWVAKHCGADLSVGLMLPASVGGALANLGVTLAGKIAVNLNFTAGETYLQSAMTRCEIKTVLSSRAFLEKAKLNPLPGTVFLEDLLPSFGKLEQLRALLAARFASTRSLAGPAKPDDIAAVIFSSGSTGDPKGIALSHWNLIANAEASADVYWVGRGDCMMGVLPFFHAFGYTYTLWLPLLKEFPAVYHPNPSEAQIIGELAAKYRPTVFLSTPTFCLAYLRKCSREQLASIRYFLVGAEKLRPALAEAYLEKFGIELLEGYGCTEMGPVISVNAIGGPVEHAARSLKRLGSVGRPVPTVAVRIVDPYTFEPLPAGETGLLLVNSPSRMSGYLGDSAKTSSVLRDGFYITGDLAKVDRDGFLYIVDRLSRFSKIAGEMVPHLRLEEALHPLFPNSPCLVVGIPDERRGERLAVLYTNREVPVARMIEQLNTAGLPPLWIPKRESFYYVDAIPALGTGKTDLAKARALAAEFFAAAEAKAAAR